MMPYTSTTSATIDSSTPDGSIRCGCGSFESGTSTTMATRPTITIGTFTRKIDPHQKYFSNAPPAIGPNAIAAPDAPAQMPMAFGRSPGSKTFWMIDRVCGCTAAAPIPINARNRISVVAEPANEHSAEVAPNNAIPRTRIFLRPTRSPVTPQAISSPANTSA